MDQIFTVELIIITVNLLYFLSFSIPKFSGQNWAVYSALIPWRSLAPSVLRKTQISQFSTNFWRPAGGIWTRRTLKVSQRRSARCSWSCWLWWAPTRTCTTQRPVPWAGALRSAVRTASTCSTTYWRPTPGSWLTTRCWGSRKLRLNPELRRRTSPETKDWPGPRWRTGYTV